MKFFPQKVRATASAKKNPLGANGLMPGYLRLLPLRSSGVYILWRTKFALGEESLEWTA